jgi:ABC-2 type transport system ATP-binding protein
VSSIVEIQDLTRRYGSFEAVRGLSLTIPGGEIFGLLGPNGAGKSTTLKILATLLKPTSGSVSLRGRDVVAQANEVRPIIGYVPEGAELYEALNFVAPGV